MDLWDLQLNLSKFPKKLFFFVFNANPTVRQSSLRTVLRTPRNWGSMMRGEVVMFPPSFCPKLIQTLSGTDHTQPPFACAVLPTSASVASLPPKRLTVALTVLCASPRVFPAI